MVVVVVSDALRVVRVDPRLLQRLVVVVVRGGLLQMLQRAVQVGVLAEAGRVRDGARQRVLAGARVVQRAAGRVRGPATAPSSSHTVRLWGRRRLAQQGQVGIGLAHCAVVVLVVFKIRFEV